MVQCLIAHGEGRICLVLGSWIQVMCVQTRKESDIESLDDDRNNLVRELKEAELCFHRPFSGSEEKRATRINIS